MTSELNSFTSELNSLTSDGDRPLGDRPLVVFKNSRLILSLKRKEQTPSSDWFLQHRQIFDNGDRPLNQTDRFLTMGTDLYGTGTGYSLEPELVTHWNRNRLLIGTGTGYSLEPEPVTH
ncbi:MAG: hypothetical protein LBQ77_00310 [Treponema sp.]|nr:hypothetical protein [Treponema sp.]